MKRVIVVTKIKRVLDQLDSLIYKCDTQTLQSIWDNLESFHTKTLITDPLLRAFPFDRTIDMWTRNEKKSSNSFEVSKKDRAAAKCKERTFLLDLFRVTHYGGDDELVPMFALDSKQLGFSKAAISKIPNADLDVPNPEGDQMLGHSFKNGWYPNIYKAFDYEFFLKMEELGISRKYKFMWLDWCSTSHETCCKTISYCFAFKVFSISS